MFGDRAPAPSNGLSRMGVYFILALDCGERTAVAEEGGDVKSLPSPPASEIEGLGEEDDVTATPWEEGGEQRREYGRECRIFS